MAGSIRVPRRTVDLFDFKTPYPNGSVPLFNLSTGQWEANVLSTSIVPEGSNQYFTAGRLASALPSIPVSTLGPATSDISLNSHKITGLGDGVAGTDAVNLNQLNSAIGSVHWTGLIGNVADIPFASGLTFTDNAVDLDTPLLVATLTRYALSFNNDPFQIAGSVDWNGNQIAAGYIPALNSLTSPTGDLSLNSHKITNLADGVSSGDATNLNQVNNLVNAAFNGNSWKNAARIVVSTNVTLSSPGATLDSVGLSAGDRVLLAGQTTGSQNGLYVWNGASSAMTRSTDSDSNTEVKSGLTVPISEGTQADKIALLTTNDPITIGTTSLAFTFFSSPGVYLPGTGISISGGTISIDSGYIGQTSIITTGTISTGTWNATTIGITKGGTGQVTANAGFNALSPLTTVGDLLYGAASGTGTRLAGNTATTLNVLTQTGDGTNSAAPAWLGTTGTGNVARATSPTFISPTLGSASATGINRVSITTPASLAVLTIANLKTFTCSNTLTLAGTDTSTLNVGTGGTLGTAAFTAASAYEVPLTFGSGVSRSVNAVSIDQAFANVWTAKQTAQLTTTQFEGGYDSSNKWTWTVGSTGGLTLAGAGTGGSLTLTPTSGQAVIVTGTLTAEGGAYTTLNLSSGAYAGWKHSSNTGYRYLADNTGDAYIQAGTSHATRFRTEASGSDLVVIAAAATTVNNASTFSAAGAASAPALKLTGTPFAGTGITSTGLLALLDSAATASTTLPTAGIYFMVNGHGTANHIWTGTDGVQKFGVDSTGAVTAYGQIGTTNGVKTFAMVVDSSFGYLQTSGNSQPIKIQGNSLIIEQRISTDSSGTPITTSLTRTYNQTSTAGSVDLKIVRTEPALGSGTHYPIQVLAGTLGTTDIFHLDNTGLITSPSATLQGTTRQLRLAYDGSNYQDFAVDSSGGLTISGTGAGGAITLKPVSGQAIYHNTGGSLTSAITGGGFRMLNGLTYSWTSGPGSVAADTSISRTSAGVVAIGNGTAGDASGSLTVNAIQTGTHSFVDAANIAVGTATGTKIGTSASQKIGIWNATPVVQPASANQAAITDSTGGSTSDATIVDVGAVPLQASINNNFAKLTKLLNQLRADLVTTGLVKGAA